MNGVSGNDKSQVKYRFSPPLVIPKNAVNPSSYVEVLSSQQKNSTVLVKHGLLMASTLAAEVTKAEGTASILWTAVVNMYYWGDNYKMQTSHTLCSRPKRYGALLLCKPESFEIFEIAIVR